MKIPDKVYDELTAAKRVRATVSAIARNDESEVKTLRETCPKEPYYIPDPKYREGIDNLISTARFVEFQLRGIALDFHLASRRQEWKCLDEAISLAASLETAWLTILAELEITPEEMTKASVTRHPCVHAIVRMGEGEEKEDDVAWLLDRLRQIIET